MARTKKQPEPELPVAAVPRRILRCKGPLSPSEIEITALVGVKGGQLADTPDGFAPKIKNIKILVSDKASFADSVPHKDFVQIEDEAAFRQRMLELTFQHHEMRTTNREATVAGSLPILDAALRDAFKIILVGDDETPTVPAFLSDWKASKVDNHSSHPTITLTRI